MECDMSVEFIRSDGNRFQYLGRGVGFYMIPLSLMTTFLLTGESDVHPALRNAVHHAH